MIPTPVGKVAIATGGASGLGRCFVCEFSPKTREKMRRDRPSPPKGPPADVAESALYRAAATRTIGTVAAADGETSARETA